MTKYQFKSFFQFETCAAPPDWQTVESVEETWLAVFGLYQDEDELW